MTADTLTFPAGVDSLASFWVKPPAGVVDNVSEAFPIVAPSDETLVRMRVNASLSIRTPIQVNAQQKHDDFAFGIIRWADVDDTEPSILDVPFPIESAASDWLWHWHGWVTSVAGKGVGGSDASSGVTIFDNQLGPESLIDVRSQRKLSANEGLLAVFEYRNNGVFGVSPDIIATLGLFTRMLFKLP